MATQYVAAGTVNYPTGGEALSFVLPLPSGTQAGDVFVVFVGTTTNGLNGGLTLPANTDTLFAMSSTTSGGISAGLYWYTAPSSPPASITFLWGGSTARRGSISWVQLRPGAGGTLTNNAYADTGWLTTTSDLPLSPSVTTTAANAYVLVGTNYGSGSTDPVPPAGGTLVTNPTERDGAIAIKGLQASAGATGVSQWDLSSSGSYRTRSWTLAVVETGGASVPVFVDLAQGIPTATGHAATARVSDTTSAKLRLGTGRSGDTLTGTVVEGPSVAPDADGYVKLTASGLTPDTSYYVQVAMTNSSGSTTSGVFGPIRTAPTPGTPTSFSVLFGGDLQDEQTNTTAFDNMLNHSAAFVFSTGDTHNGDNTSTSQASHRADWENIRSINPGFRDMLRNRPFAQSFGDHDQGGGNNSVPGAWTAPNIAAYRQVFSPPPSPNLPATTGWSFVWGRVRFISPDWGHERTSTYKLGATQMAWLEAELNQPEPLKVLIVGSVWYDEEAPEGWPGGDGWADYATQRAAIQALIEAAPGDVLGVHGDQHALAAMSGAGNPYGGFPVVGGSPWSGWSSYKGDVNPDGGRWPLDPGEAVVRQFGKLTFEDAGTHIVVTYRGYDNINMVRVSLTFGTGGYVPPQTIEATSTASLTAPADRWVKSLMKPSWYDPVAGQWRAILPTSTGHRLFTLSKDDGAVAGAAMSTAQSSRYTAWHHQGTTYLLRIASNGGWFSVRNSAWTETLAEVNINSALGTGDNDANPVSLLRSSSGALWVAAIRTNAVRIYRSTDGGATWLTATVVTDGALSGGTGTVALAQTGSTIVLLATGNDGLGRWVRTIPESSGGVSSSFWSNEALPALPSPLTSDDHLAMTALPDGRLFAVSKTTGSTTGTETLLYSLIRATSGVWTAQQIEVGPDDYPGWTRPNFALDAEGGITGFYGDYNDFRELMQRTTASDALGSWSGRTLALGPVAGDFSDGSAPPDTHDIAAAAAAGKPWPLLVHDRSAQKIWLAWFGAGAAAGQPPARVGGTAVAGLYVGAVLVQALYVGSSKIY